MDIPVGSRWRDREAGGRVAVVLRVRLGGDVEIYYADDPARVPWYTLRVEWTLWHRFERLPDADEC